MVSGLRLVGTPRRGRRRRQAMCALRCGELLHEGRRLAVRKVPGRRGTEMVLQSCFHDAREKHVHKYSTP